MVGHEELALTQEEANQLVELINKHFIDEPWTLYSFAPHRWYLRLDKHANLTTTPLVKVLGEDINQFSPSGEDANYWFKIINELQMLIHGSNVNFERESKNMIMANSVWLWGGGCLPELQLNTYYDKVLTNNITYSGIGYHCGFDVLELDSSFVENIKEQNNFVVMDILSEQVQCRDLYTFTQTLNKLEADFFVYCNDLLVKGSIGEIKLITDVGIFTITKKQLSHWWKRTKSFTSLNFE